MTPWSPSPHLQGWVLSTHPCTLLHCAAVCCLLHLQGGTGAKITLRATRRHYSPLGQGDMRIIWEPWNLKFIFQDSEKFIELHHKILKSNRYFCCRLHVSLIIFQITFIRLYTLSKYSSQWGFESTTFIQSTDR